MIKKEEKMMLDESYQWYLKKKKENNPNIDFKNDLNIKMTNYIYNYLIDENLLDLISSDDFVLLQKILFKDYLNKDSDYLKFFMNLELIRKGRIFKENEIIQNIIKDFIYLKFANDFEKYIIDCKDNHFLTNDLLNDSESYVNISIPAEIHFFVKRNREYDNENNLNICKEIILNSDTENIYYYLMKKFMIKKEFNVFKFLSNVV